MRELKVVERPEVCVVCANQSREWLNEEEKGRVDYGEPESWGRHV